MKRKSKKKGSGITLHTTSDHHIQMVDHGTSVAIPTSGAPSPSAYSVIHGGHGGTANTYAIRPSKVKEAKAEEVQYEIKPDGLNGLVVFYFNVDDIPEEELSEYLDQLIEDNDDIAESFSEVAFEPIWFSFRGKRASHIEIWPLAHSREKKIKFSIHRDKPRGGGYYGRGNTLHNVSVSGNLLYDSPEELKEDDQEQQMLAVIQEQFTEKYPKIASELEKQEFTIEWVTTSYPTRIIVY